MPQLRDEDHPNDEYCFFKDSEGNREFKNFCEFRYTCDYVKASIDLELKITLTDFSFSKEDTDYMDLIIDNDMMLEQLVDADGDPTVCRMLFTNQGD